MGKRSADAQMLRPFRNITIALRRGELRCRAMQPAAHRPLIGNCAATLYIVMHWELHDGTSRQPRPQHSGQPMSRLRDQLEITTDILLRAYSIGLFPMAESADDPNLFWVEPEVRGIFPLDDIIISRSLAKTVRSDVFEVRVDHDFDAVMDGCAAAMRGSREDLDQRAASGGCIGSCSTWAASIRWRPGGTAFSSAAFTGCASARPSLAKACSIARPTPRRWRWCISPPGCALAGSACSTHNSSRRISPRSARSRCQRKSIGAASPKRWRARPTSGSGRKESSDFRRRSAGRSAEKGSRGFSLMASRDRAGSSAGRLRARSSLEVRKRPSGGASALRKIAPPPIRRMSDRRAPKRERFGLEGRLQQDEIAIALHQIGADRSVAVAGFEPFANEKREDRAQDRRWNRRSTGSGRPCSAIAPRDRARAPRASGRRAFRRAARPCAARGASKRAARIIAPNARLRRRRLIVIPPAGAALPRPCAARRRDADAKAQVAQRQRAAERHDRAPSQINGDERLPVDPRVELSVRRDVGDAHIDLAKSERRDAGLRTARLARRDRSASTARSTALTTPPERIVVRAKTSA